MYCSMTSSRTAAPAATTKFYVFYDGKSHDNHEINIVTLGSSLMAMGRALDAANKELNGWEDNAVIDVRVNAEFVEGSFGVEIEVLQFLAGAKDIVAALGFSAIAGGGVLGAIDWLKGDSVDVGEVDDQGNSVLKVEADGDKPARELTCDDDIARLVSSPIVRKAMQEIIADPLKNEGTDKFLIRASRDITTDPVVAVEKSEANKFVSPPRVLKEVHSKDETEQKVLFTAANVNKKTGWKMFYKEKELSVRMDDEAFLARLQGMKEAYVFGKVFNVKLKEEKVVSGSSEKIKYTIVSVRHESKG